jgi:crotonobetainyl-CoA:carnitine CoA-transferase CaiB-like acyl-CoA transferase
VHLFPYLPRHYAAIFGEAGVPGADHDPRYEDQRATLRNSDSLYRDIRSIAPMHTTQEWLDYCRKQGIPATRVATLQSLVDDLPMSQHPAVGAYRVIPQMSNFDRTPGGLRRPAPLIGEHTGEVFAQLDALDAMSDPTSNEGSRDAS